ncbi:hypothetical protein PRECH8_14120 [Insulibacter thermoxylanivorax]|uniref:Uncharacterized protein n=1 Tax=Insulibacter thermoxylanivorax TaxID=2749268 RepID=A0A916QGK3_9BACL|nr:hypothetical protein PRECH8_14120 [Insulibacter thermoxylanivorax]
MKNKNNKLMPAYNLIITSTPLEVPKLADRLLAHLIIPVCKRNLQEIFDPVIILIPLYVL